MSAGDIYGKTTLGVSEVSVRKIKLAPRLRTMLILIDGRQPALVLQDEAEKLGAPADFLAQLLGMRLIEKVGSVISQESKAADELATHSAPVGDEYSRFGIAKDFMNVTMVDALGIKSFFFTLKLERAGNLADLRELVDSYRTAMSKASGEDQARVFTARLNAMLR